MWRLRDHPRSRGVYGAPTAADWQRIGSSPLARGLLGTVLAVQPLTGIIPARAGFTDRIPGDGVEAEDHPRSRGVYAYARVRADRRGGSSPLARGLHERRGQGSHSPGIIPARAGFTQGCTGCSVYTRDHPRSRGVYARHCRVLRALCGSSPLARGLLGPSHCPAVAAMDHPRSRGVYCRSACQTQTGWGSSPLARGLHALS